MLKTLKRLASALLMAAVGTFAGVAFGGALTFYVYFLGAGPASLLGMAAGALFGWRTPLRDSTILSVAVAAGTLAGSALSARVTPGLRENDPGAAGLLDLTLPVLGGLAGALLLFVPVRALLPFEQRRPTAFAAAVFAAAWLLGRLYHYAYVWQP